MMSTDAELQDVVVGVTIAAAPAAVFAFFSNAAAFQRWMGPGSTIAPSVGGEIRVAYRNGDIAIGHVDVFEPNERIAFSWGYEGGANGIAIGATHVEVTLTPVVGGTRVVLRHSGIADADKRKGHRMGWRFYLAALSSSVTTWLDNALESVVDDYISAWSEKDPALRRDLLSRVWETAGTFSDAMGYAEGIDDLDEHIAMAQMYAANMQLERSGPVLRSHGSIAYRWQIRDGSGAVVMSGINTGELSPTGRLQRVTGFGTPNDPSHSPHTSRACLHAARTSRSLIILPSVNSPSRRILQLVVASAALLDLTPEAAAQAANRLDHDALRKTVAEVIDADYRGDRSRLDVLQGELARFTTEDSLAARAHYWRGFAFWRSALNSANDGVPADAIIHDYERAVDEFRLASGRDSSDLDPKIGAASAMLNIAYFIRTRARSLPRADGRGECAPRCGPRGRLAQPSLCLR